MDDLVKMMEETGLPFAYDHFEEGKQQSHRLYAIFFRRVIIFLRTGRCI